MPPFSTLPNSKPISNASRLESRTSSKFLEGVNLHQRCTSESFLIDEQPSWLDDLLNDSETIFHRGHRRSASDSYAYLGEEVGDESQFVNAYFGASTISQKPEHYNDIKGNSMAQTKHQVLDQSDQGGVCKLYKVKQNRFFSKASPQSFKKKK